MRLSMIAFAVSALINLSLLGAPPALGAPPSLAPDRGIWRTADQRISSGKVLPTIADDEDEGDDEEGDDDRDDDGDDATNGWHILSAGLGAGPSQA